MRTLIQSFTEYITRGVNMKRFFLTIFLIFSWSASFAQVQINRPGFIPKGLLICDELTCKLLPDDRETPAQILSYDPQVGVSVLINKKRYVVPGNDVMVNNAAKVICKKCNIPLGDYIRNKRDCIDSENE